MVAKNILSNKKIEKNRPPKIFKLIDFRLSSKAIQIVTESVLIKRINPPTESKIFCSSSLILNKKYESNRLIKKAIKKLKIFIFIHKTILMIITVMVEGLVETNYLIRQYFEHNPNLTCHFSIHTSN